jgi:hypothetical protein
VFGIATIVFGVSESRLSLAALACSAPATW